MTRITPAVNSVPDESEVNIIKVVAVRLKAL
jgi:hypothetical protein